MPNFANPFQGNVDRKLTNAELMQALRLDIAGELEAIFLYDAHYLATDDPVAIMPVEISPGVYGTAGYRPRPP